MKNTNQKYWLAPLMVLIGLLLVACGSGGGGDASGRTASGGTASYAVKATAGSGGSVAPATATVAAGDTASFTVTPDSGYAIGSVTGCGGSLAGDTYTTWPASVDCTVSARFTPAPPPAPTLSLTPQAVKTFHFSWTDVDGETEYRLLENPDGSSGYSQVAGIAADASSHDLIVSLPARINASYILQACNAGGCSDSTEVFVTGALEAAIGYVKASNTDAVDGFGWSVALAGDGATLAVGATGEDSAAAGIGGDQADNTASNAGAVYVFTRDGAGVWSQQAYIKASNPDASDNFGNSVALSGDGNALAVGATYEQSAATGIGGNQADNSVSGGSGAVYVFSRDPAGAWSQRAYVKASNTDWGDYFGSSVALAGDGATLAVGAMGEQSAATGIDGDQADNSLVEFAGAVYVFTRDGAGAWSQQAYIKASNTDASDNFGSSVALAGDGATLAVGAYGEDSAAGGIGGNQADNSAGNSGAVYVFTRDGAGTWSQQAYVKASNPDANDTFGGSVTLADDGATLAVGATGEASAATGIGGNQNDNTAGTGTGAVYVFTRDGAGAWSQQAYVKASNPDRGDNFGGSVALAGDGDTLAVGAREYSAATGIGGDQADNSLNSAGAVYVFSRDPAGAWSQRAYVKASNTDAGDKFGNSVALAGDGATLAVGAIQEGSPAIGIGGNQADDTAGSAGAVYLF